MLKLNIRKVTYELCMAMPAIFTVLYCIRDNVANKAAIVLMLFAYILINSHYMRNGKKIRFFIFNFLTIIYIGYIGIKCGVSEIISSFFYGYLLTFIMILICTEDNLREEFIQYFLARKKRFAVYVTIFFMTVVFSVVFLNGLKVGYGSKIPVLYGPFSIAHMLAYLLMVVYCGVSLFDLENKKKTIVAIKLVCVICIACTAVRSAVLATAVLIVCDFLSIRKISKKAIILGVGFIILVFLATNTDILTNNPLIEKTLYATDVGGSITNGREWYRQIALSYYATKTTLLEKIFGVGISGVVEAIYSVLRVRIQAHNDYVNLLVGYGIVGLVSFVICQLGLRKTCKSKMNVILLQLFIFILAYYNGFALYIMLTASLPIVVAFFELKQVGGCNAVEENEL